MTVSKNLSKSFNESITVPTSLDFELPKLLECAKPTEVRGIRRDEVRLMVSDLQTDEFHHTLFKGIDQYLQAGDVLVVNTSGTLKAALEAIRAEGQQVRIHFSTQSPDGSWIVEVREVLEGRTHRFRKSIQGEVLQLKNGGSIELLEPYYPSSLAQHLQLWKVAIRLPVSLTEYLDHFGLAIRYNYVEDAYPSAYYQTAFAQEAGSAEMPSAGRAFTPELITRLVAKGVYIAPILLHTGVASLESDERPYEEFFRVPEATAELVNLVRSKGRRVVAVGTTAVRALESSLTDDGQVRQKEGWTNLYITPERGMKVVDGLLTGFHEPRASHLLMLEALAGRHHLKLSYLEALKQQYQWHEFGDLHLMI